MRHAYVDSPAQTIKPMGPLLTMPLSETFQPWPLLLALRGLTAPPGSRTLSAMAPPPLAADLQLSPAQLGLFAATIQFALGAMQVFMGVSCYC